MINRKKTIEILNIFTEVIINVNFLRVKFGNLDTIKLFFPMTGN